MYRIFRQTFVENNPQKKQLTLVRNYGSVKMLAHFGSGRVTYQFITSFRQTVILLLFNRHLQLSFDQLQTQTKMNAKPLLRTLDLFIKYQLLQIVEELKPEQKEEEGEMSGSFY